MIPNQTQAPLTQRGREKRDTKRVAYLPTVLNEERANDARSDWWRKALDTNLFIIAKSKVITPLVGVDEKSHVYASVSVKVELETWSW